MSDTFTHILLNSLVSGFLAVIFVFAIRVLVRKQLGAIASYKLWAIVPVAMAVALVPVPTLFENSFSGQPLQAEKAMVSAEVIDSHSINFEAARPIEKSSERLNGLSNYLFPIWLSGFVVSIFWVFAAHFRFLITHQLIAIGSGRMKRIKNSDHITAPMAVGVIRPKVILPENFKQHYCATERKLILAHERSHITSGDLIFTFVALVLRSVNWFNPAFYVAYNRFKFDQELSCDARVMTKHSGQEKAYARALLKVQCHGTSGLLVSHWGTGGADLKGRIKKLSHREPEGLRKTFFKIAVTISLGAFGLTSWAAFGSHSGDFKYSTVKESEIHLYEGNAGAMLVVAIKEGNREVYTHLIEQGADVNYFLEREGTPLVAAIQYREFDLAHFLLDNGAEAGLAAPGEGSPLIKASATGNLPMVKRLISMGADVNGYVPGDETPLINAAEQGNVEIVAYLIAQGADVNLSVKSNNWPRGFRSPLSRAREFGRTRVIELLKRHGATQ